MPIGVRTPVASMSIRFLIGIVHALVTPGSRTARSISLTSRSVVMSRRHSSCGFRTTVVSYMSSGAGSVAVFARPTLPNTEATSGKLAKTLS